MPRNRLVAALDERNAGVLIVRLDGNTPRSMAGKLVGADDIARKLDKKEESCFIM